MRRHHWIFRQLFISLMLLKIFLIIIPTTVGASVIRKKETIENNTLTPATEIATEEVVTVKDVVTSTELSVGKSTSLPIARVTANDLIQGKRKKPQISIAEEEVLNTTITTTEGFVEILKVGNTSVPRNSELTTEAAIEETTTETTTFNVSTIKDAFKQRNFQENQQSFTDKFITTEAIGEREETTISSLKQFDYNKFTLSNNNSTIIKSIKDDRPVNSELRTVNFEKQFEEPVLTTTQSSSLYDTQSELNHQEEKEFSTLKSIKDDEFETTTMQQLHADSTPTNTSDLVLKTTTISTDKFIDGTSRHFDIATNEIKNLTNIPSSTKAGEKRAKQLKDSNMTLPDAPEIWALAGMTNFESTKENDEKKFAVNSTVVIEENILPEVNTTSSTKLLADWTQIMKEVDFNNNSINTNPNSIENALENGSQIIKKLTQTSQENPEQENQVIAIGVTNPSSRMTISNYSSTTNLTTKTSTTSLPVDETEKTTPSIEKNQVEDADSDYVKNKKNKIKYINRTTSHKEELSKITLSSTTEPILIQKLPMTTIANKFERIVQFTGQSQSTTTATILSQSTPTTTATILSQSTPTTTKTQLLLPRTSSSATTTISSTSTPESAVISVSIRSTSDSSSNTLSLSVTEGKKTPSETTTEQISIAPILDTTVSLNLDKTSTDSSSELEIASAADSSTSNLYSQISESTTTTDSFENIPSSTYDDITTTSIEMQLKPDNDNQASSTTITTTTKDLFKSTTESFLSEASSTTETKFSTTSEESIVSNAIEKIPESTTTAETDQYTEEISKMSTTTFIFPPGMYETIPGIDNATDDISTTTIFQNTPIKYEQPYLKPTKSLIVPKLDEIITERTVPITTTTHDPQVGGMVPPPNNVPNETDYNVIIAISVSVVGIIALILLVGFLYVMRKRQKNLTYSQRCRPVSLDAYSLDNVSVFNSVRRKGALRASKRSYGNVAFDDPSLKHNVLNFHDLAKFVDKKATIHEEFKDVPQIITRPDEVPQGCEDKNRYANVIPLPETRVILQQTNGDEKTEYINANFVRGPKDPPNYYIACQAPLESTIPDFWRMIWEQNSRVIIMATDLVENGKEKCAEYLPPSITIDNHVMYGDFQITLKNREVKEKYAVSTLHVKNNSTNTWREITHFWYQWPDTGVPNDEAAVIAMLLEARSCLKISNQEQTDNNEDGKANGANVPEANGNADKTKSLSKTQGPMTVHCSPGTGRTGTIIACDIALRSLETPKRTLDIPQIVYYVRRGRASAVQTKEQYEFIYRVAHMYATKISGPIGET